MVIKVTHSYHGYYTKVTYTVTKVTHTVTKVTHKVTMVTMVTHTAVIAAAATLLLTGRDRHSSGTHSTRPTVTQQPTTQMTQTMQLVNDHFAEKRQVCVTK